MNRFFTLLLAASCLTAVGQELDGWCCDPESYFFEGVGCEVESPLDGFVGDPDCADWASECVDVAACNYAEWGACNYECEGCRISTACNYNGSVLFGNIDLCLFPNGYCHECGGNPTNGQGFVTIQDSDNDEICDLDDPCVGGCLEGCEPPGPELEISLDGVELSCNNELSFEDQVLSALQICSSTPSDSLIAVAAVDNVESEEGQFFAMVTVAVYDFTQSTNAFWTEFFPVQGYLENGECQILGCTSAEACNFNPEANSDDGSCDFVSCLDSDGLCCDQDSQNYAYYSCIICNPSDGLVCDPDCSDFNPFVCQGIGGCLDENACNYDSVAAYGDDSCDYAFCAETCEGGCAFTEANIYFTESVGHYGDPSFPPTEYYVPPELECFFYSDQYPSPPNGPTGKLFFNGVLVYEGVFNYFSTFYCGGNYVGGGGFGDLSCGSSVYGGGGLTCLGITDWNYPCGVDSLEFHFPSEACGEVVLKGVWNGNQLGYLSGCTSEYALNYSSEATCDDGTCVFEGCTDPLSCNFDAEASSDDGSCDYSCCPGPGCCSQGLLWDWELGQCFPINPADINFDGCVQLNDLLDLLSAYGDCGAEESAWQCGDPLEYQGYDYETVQIGEQCWFAENLRAQALQTGEEVPYSSGAGSLPLSPAYFTQPYLGYEDSFGLLYNAYTFQLNDICPTGWDMPNDDDWIELRDYVGGQEIAGNRLKAQGNEFWQDGNQGTDDFSFSVRGGGWIFGSYSEYLTGARFWSKDNDCSNCADGCSNVWDFGHNYPGFGAFSNCIGSNYAASIRCIKDTEQ